MNIFLRFSIIVLGILAPFFGVFAASGQEHAGTNTIEGTASGKEQEEIKTIKDVKKDIKTTLKNIEKVKEDEDVTDVSEINKAIIQLYKMQGNKVLKELDQSLQKFYDDDETRMQAYKQIQWTYIALKKKSQNAEMSENNKKILWAYLDYMISMLDKKVQELTE